MPRLPPQPPSRMQRPQTVSPPVEQSFRCRRWPAWSLPNPRQAAALQPQPRLCRSLRRPQRPRQPKQRPPRPSLRPPAWRQSTEPMTRQKPLPPLPKLPMQSQPKHRLPRQLLPMRRPSEAAPADTAAELPPVEAAAPVASLPEAAPTAASPAETAPAVPHPVEAAPVAVDPAPEAASAAVPPAAETASPPSAPTQAAEAPPAAAAGPAPAAEPVADQPAEPRCSTKRSGSNQGGNSGAVASSSRQWRGKGRRLGRCHTGHLICQRWPNWPNIGQFGDKSVDPGRSLNSPRSSARRRSSPCRPARMRACGTWQCCRAAAGRP